MDASKRSPFKRVLTAMLAVVLTLGLTPAGAWAAVAEGGGQAAPLLAAGSLDAQARSDGNTVTIGEGTSSQYNVPYCTYYKNGGVESLYLASELGEAGAIQSIAYDVVSGGPNQATSLKIYLGQTSASSISGTNPLAPDGGWALVYSGTPNLGAGGTGWETMQFDTPFEYDGENNLLVLMVRQSSSDTKVNYNCTSASNMVVYKQSDSDSATYADSASFMAASALSTISYRPNTQFVIETAKGPKFTQQPEGFTYQAGAEQTTALTAKATSETAVSAYQWYRSADGTFAKAEDLLAAATGESPTATAIGEPQAGVEEDGVYTFAYTPEASELTQAGVVYYYCLATSGEGSSITEACAVEVFTEAASAPTGVLGITVTPAATDGALTVPEDTEVNLTADGVEKVHEADTLHYQWFAKGSSDADFTAIEGATSDTYTFNASVGTTQYKCQVWATYQIESNVSPAVDSSTVSITGKAVPTEAVEVTIGDGTTTNSNVPLSLNYNNSASEMLYLASEVANAEGAAINKATISALAFTYGSSKTERAYTSMQVWMGYTGVSELTSAVAPTDAKLVYSDQGGQIAKSADTELVINLTEPFKYDASKGNLLVIMNLAGTTYKSTNFICTSGITTRSYKNDGASLSPDVSAVVNGLNASENARPDVRFELKVPISGPSIKSAPEGFTYKAGTEQTTALSFDATSAAESVSAQWYKSSEGDITSAAAIASATAIGEEAAYAPEADGSFTVSYVPSAADLGTEAGTSYLYCLLTDDNGSALSQPAAIDVYTEDAPAPEGMLTIVSDPAAENDAIELGETTPITFTATGITVPEGDVLYYQWYKKGATDSDFTAIEDATEATYVTKAIAGVTQYKVEAWASHQIPSNLSPKVTSANTITVTGEALTITTAEGLAAFRDTVNEGDSFEGRTVLLGADIDLSGIDNWVAIGTSVNPFRGTFDGQGHKINGMTINASEMYQGLFGYVRGATFKNFTVSGNATSSTHYLAGVAAYAYGPDTFENVGSEVNITSTGNYVAGIVGYCNQNNADRPITFTKCYNKGTIATNAASSTMVAGIVGRGNNAPYCVLTSCYNTGAITAYNNAGGLVGNNGTAINCYNAATVTASGSYTGSLAGRGIIANVDAPSFVLEGTHDRIAGSAADNEEAIIAVTAEQLAGTEAYEDATLLEALNEASPDTWIAGDALDPAQASPALAWEGVPIIPEPTTFTATFNVTDASTQTAITDATITVKLGDEPVAAEADDTFKLEEGVEYTYTVVKDGYEPAEGTLALSADQTVDVALVKIIDPADQAAVDAVAASFTGYSFPIRYAKGYTNVNDAVKDVLKESAEWQDAMTVRLKSYGETDMLDADGTIHYKTGAFGYVNVENVSNCVFTVELNGATADTAGRTVQIGWDLAYYKDQMQAEADAFSADSLKGENESLDAVTSELSLKGTGGENAGSSWSLIEWTSSNPDLIAINEKDYTRDFIGTVTRPSGDDAEVTLTATFKANDSKLTSNCENQEEIGTITKTFTVTVTGMHKPPVTEERLASLLDTYYNNPDYANAFININGTYLDVSQGVDSNFMLPRYTNIRTEVDADKLDDWGHVFANREITVASEDESVLKVNGYSVTVDPSNLTEDTTVNLVVTLTREGISGTKDIPVLVKASLTDEMLEAEAAKLQLVIDHYWDGINDGQYASIDEVVGSLHAFQEANVDGEGNVTFVYNASDKTGAGFKPDSYFEDPWEMEGAGYNLFKSSEPTILQHENLVMPVGAQPADSVQVTISSLISSETFGAMAAANPDNAKLQALYKQEASATVTVLGTKIVAAREAVAALKDASELTEADKDAVIDARALYDGLSASDKALFGDELLDKLNAAEAALGIASEPAFASESFTFSVSAGEALNETIAATGTPTPVIALAEGSTLPSWLELSELGALTGTAPSEEGTFTFNVTATNTIQGEVKTATATVTVTVTVPAAAKPVDVYMTVSNAGTLALARQQVTATDANEDGIVTFDEALQAAHAKYCPGGYATSASAYGAQVTKLWGVATTNLLFYKNDVIPEYAVDAVAVAAGDDLVAAILADENYSDYYAYFDKKQVSAKVGEEFTLTLSARSWSEPTAASGIQIGTWANNAFTPISGKTTNVDGNITLSFDAPGTYVVSARGTLNADVVVDPATGETQNMDCPLIAPACVVTVEQDADTSAADELAKAVKNAQAANVADASQAAKDALAKAIKDAQAVLADPNATSEQIAAAKAALNKALKTATDEQKAANQKKANEAKNGLAVGKTFTVTTKQGTFTYKVTATKQVTLTKAAKTKAKGKVTVNKVAYNGVTYQVTAIGAKAFKGSKLAKVTVGANVRTVGAQAFLNSKNLKTLIVGKNVKSIGAKTFKGAKKLTKITVKSSKLKAKKAVKNALKGSKIKTVKIKGVKGAAKKKVIKAFKKAGKKGVTVK